MEKKWFLISVFAGPWNALRGVGHIRLSHPRYPDLFPVFLRFARILNSGFTFPRGGKFLSCEDSA